MSNLMYELGQARIADLHRDAERHRLASLARPRMRQRRRRPSLRSLLPRWRPTDGPVPSPAPGKSSSG